MCRAGIEMQFLLDCYRCIGKTAGTMRIITSKKVKTSHRNLKTSSFLPPECATTSPLGPLEERFLALPLLFKIGRNSAEISLLPDRLRPFCEGQWHTFPPLPPITGGGSGNFAQACAASHVATAPMKLQLRCVAGHKSPRAG